MRSAGGTITAFDPAGSQATEVYSINRGGAVTGYWSDGTNVHGFVRSAAGKITSFDPQNSTDPEPYSINDRGQIAGWYGAGCESFLRTS
ncbi:MAG TPA: hypothetical protein VHT03_10590 [Rhizomicrobium sp.]|nr:hypothetical protein [Rhizomicrobium sp.]